MVKMLILATLTLMASASAYRIDPQPASPMGNNMLKSMCEQNGVNYDTVENSAFQFLNCLQYSFGVNSFESELKQAELDHQYKKVFQKYCAKSPQLKSCYHTFFDGVIPCVDGGKYDITKAIKNVTDQVLDFVCVNDGEPITRFMRDGGPHCFQSKQFEIMMCAEYYKNTVMYMEKTMDLSAALRLNDELLKCIAKRLDTCHNPTASFFFTDVSKIVRDGFTQFQVPQSATNDTDTTPQVKYNENGTQAGSVTTSVVVPRYIGSTEPTRQKQIDQFQLMCEQNGVDYHALVVAINNFTKEMDKNFDFNKLIETRDNSSYNKLFKEYCAKQLPQAITKLHKLMNVMSPCLGVEGHNISIITKNVDDRLLEYMCYNDGSRITKFLTEGGPECIMSKRFEIMQCSEDTRSTFRWFTPQNTTASVTEIFSNYEAMFNCLARTIETCDSPIPKEILKSIIKIVHNTISQGAVEPISKVTITAVSPVIHTKPEPEEPLGNKIRNMCKANGEDYRIVTIIGDQAVECLEDRLNMTTEHNYFFVEFFQRFCAKKRDPYIKTCIRTFTYGVSPCFGNEAQHYLSSTVQAYDQILDYICQIGDYDGFERISKFFNERGLECLESKAHEILRCAENPKNSFLTGQEPPHSGTQINGINDDVLSCTLKKLETCDSFKVFGSIASIIRASSLEQIRQISTYNTKEHHIKTSGNVVLSFNADFVV